jgi:hypothetical protein
MHIQLHNRAALLPEKDPLPPSHLGGDSRVPVLLWTWYRRKFLPLQGIEYLNLGILYGRGFQNPPTSSFFPFAKLPPNASLLMTSRPSLLTTVEMETQDVSVKKSYDVACPQ